MIWSLRHMIDRRHSHCPHKLRICGYHQFPGTTMTSSNGNIFRVTGPLWRIHWSPVNSPHKGQWRAVLMFSFIHNWTNGWVISGDTGDLRRYCADYDVIVIEIAMGAPVRENNCLTRPFCHPIRKNTQITLRFTTWLLHNWNLLILVGRCLVYMVRHCICSMHLPLY